MASDASALLITYGDSEELSKRLRPLTVMTTTRGHELSTIEQAHRTIRDRDSLVLHDHGQWHRINRASAKAALRLHLKRVVSPRGMLSPWAMGHKRWKKRLAWSLFARRDLNAACAIHATSELEASELRAFGVRNPIIVLPNGIDELDRELLECHEHSLSSHPNHGRPYLLFLSRIHVKKGIQDLLRVWDRIAPDHCDLIIAGNDEQKLIQGRELPKGCRYVGLVEGENKANWLRNARAFVLPTYSENFGIAVVEAMTAGVPVLTTTGTPWHDLRSLNAGWYIEPGEESLARGLAEILATSSEQLQAMGDRGRQFAASNFAWRSIGERMQAAYGWVIEGGEPPEWIHLHV